MYAAVRAMEHFRVFQLGRPFLLRTDHSAPTNLLRRDLPPTTRVTRWVLRLSEYVFKIEYQRGEANVMADVLSRLPSAIGVLKTDGTPPRSTPTEADVCGAFTLADHDASLAFFGGDVESEEELDKDDTGGPALATVASHGGLDERPDESGGSLHAALDFPIAREGITVDDFAIPSVEEFAEAQLLDPEL